MRQYRPAHGLSEDSICTEQPVELLALLLQRVPAATESSCCYREDLLLESGVSANGWVRYPGSELRLAQGLKESGVHIGAYESDDLFAQGHCYRIRPDKGLGAFGTPPVKLLAALSPVSAHPLAQRPRGVAYLVNLMCKSKW